MQGSPSCYSKGIRKLHFSCPSQKKYAIVDKISCRGRVVHDEPLFTFSSIDKICKHANAWSSAQKCSDMLHSLLQNLDSSHLNIRWQYFIPSQCPLCGSTCATLFMNKDGKLFMWYPLEHLFCIAMDMFSMFKAVCSNIMGQRVGRRVSLYYIEYNWWK